MQSLFYGGAAAAIGGLLFGAAFKVPEHPLPRNESWAAAAPISAPVVGGPTEAAVFAPAYLSPPALPVQASWSAEPAAFEAGPEPLEFIDRDIETLLRRAAYDPGSPSAGANAEPDLVDEAQVSAAGLTTAAVTPAEAPAVRDEQPARDSVQAYASIDALMRDLPAVRTASM